MHRQCDTKLFLIEVRVCRTRVPFRRQAERLHFCPGSQAAAVQRTLGYKHLLGLRVQDVS